MGGKYFGEWKKLVKDYVSGIVFGGFEELRGGSCGLGEVNWKERGRWVNRRGGDVLCR